MEIKATSIYDYQILRNYMHFNLLKGKISRKIIAIVLAIAFAIEAYLCIDDLFNHGYNFISFQDYEVNSAKRKGVEAITAEQRFAKISGNLRRLNLYENSSR